MRGVAGKQSPTANEASCPSKEFDVREEGPQQRVLERPNLGICQDENHCSNYVRPEHLVAGSPALSSRS